jgi:hypothetical protein
MRIIIQYDQTVPHDLWVPTPRAEHTRTVAVLALRAGRGAEEDHAVGLDGDARRPFASAYGKSVSISVACAVSSAEVRVS